MTEDWRDIYGVGGRFVRYQVSNLGNVQHICNDGKTLLLQKFIAHNRKGDRYYVRLTTDKGKRIFYVDRLVADAFLDKDGGFLLHVNGNTLDDNAENLKYSEYQHREGRVFDFYADGKPIALGVRGFFPKETFMKWQKAVSEIVDFERTYGKLRVKGKDIMINDTIIDIRQWTGQ